MRFHFGFSKFIKPSSLLKWIAILFCGLLGYFGLTQHAYAWDEVDFYTICSTNHNCSYYNYNYTASEGEDSAYEIADSCDITDSDCIFLQQDYQWHTGVRVIPQVNFAMSTQYATNNNLTELTQTGIFQFIPNQSYCSNVSGTNSIDFKFGFVGNYQQDNNYTFFTGVSSMDDVFDFYIQAIEGTNLYTTACTKTLGANSGEYMVDCPNTYYSTDIEGYHILLDNKILIGNRFPTSSTSAKIRFPLYLGRTRAMGTSFSSLYYPMQYQCSEEEPVYNTPNDNTLGTDDMFSSIFNNFNSNISGISSNLIRYPSNIQELISLPIFVLQKINDSSTTCTPYTLDFTGIARLGNSQANNITVTLPCMRDRLSRLLNIQGVLNLYDLIDILLSALVFYNIAIWIIRFLEHLTDGDNLLLYFFGNDAYKSRHRF